MLLVLVIHLVLVIYPVLVIHIVLVLQPLPYHITQSQGFRLWGARILCSTRSTTNHGLDAVHT